IESLFHIVKVTWWRKSSNFGQVCQAAVPSRVCDMNVGSLVARVRRKEYSDSIIAIRKEPWYARILATVGSASPPSFSPGVGSPRYAAGIDYRDLPPLWQDGLLVPPVRSSWARTVLCFYHQGGRQDPDASVASGSGTDQVTGAGGRLSGVSRVVRGSHRAEREALSSPSSREPIAGRGAEKKI